MNGGHVLLLGRHFQVLVKLRLVLNAVVGKRGIHVEDISLSLPSVALRVNVYLFVAVEDLPYGFLARHFQLVFSVAERVDDPDPLAFLRQLADKELLIFPPGNGQGVSDEFQMQVPALRNIEFLLSLVVDESARLFGLLIEPAGDVCACSFDDGLHFGQVPALLDQLGEIVYIIEERHPYVVGSVMRLQL